MLSYKYYKQRHNKGHNTLDTEYLLQSHVKNIEPLKNVNRVIKHSIFAMSNKSLNDFKNPTNVYHNRYNIWDNLADNIDIISAESSLSLSQIDKLYLFKLIAEFRNKSSNNPGLEYYCLRHIIQLPVFRINKSLSNLYDRISQYINDLYRDKHTRHTINVFARNVRKMGLVKKACKSRVILRTLWCDIYNCYNMGSQVLVENVNKTDMLNALNYSNTNQELSIVEDTLEILSIQDDLLISDSELDNESVVSGIEMDVEISTESQPMLADSQQHVIDDNYIIQPDLESIHDNYDAENAEIAVEPEDW
jgi:hypothetical protein